MNKIELNILSRNKYGEYTLNSERVFISFTWQVQAIIKRRSKTVRRQEFTVSARDRAMAVYAANRKFKGAFVQQILSLTPCGFWSGCFYLDKEGHPPVCMELLSTISLPTDL